MKNFLDNNAFCILPWTHLCVRPDEKIKPCCRYQITEDVIDVNLDKIKAQGIEAMNTPYLKNLRQDMLAGKQRPECRKCYLQEKNKKFFKNRRSLRIRSNEDFSKFLKDSYTDSFDQIRYIEMSIDNICNLQCRMCDSKFSSKLQARDKFLNDTVHKKLEPTFDKFDNLDLSGLVYIKLLGGEPFISPNFLKFLDYIEQRSNPNEIHLEIATNGTSIPNESIVEKLNKYKMLEINVSLDTYDKSNDYQRVGADHTQVFKNAKIYKSLLNCENNIAIHSTISLYTANHLSKTLNFLINKKGYETSVDFVMFPKYLSLQCAPQSYKDWVLEKNKDNSKATRLINTFIKQGKYDNEQWEMFLSTTKKLDKFYNTDIKDFNPELVEYLENNYGF